MKSKSFFLSVLLLSFSALGYSRIVEIVVTESEQFLPNHIEVNVGDTIRWVHESTSTPSKFHSISSREVPLGAEQFLHSFRASELEKLYVITVPGNYTYYCYPHSPHMTGSFTASQITGVKDGSTNQLIVFPNPISHLANVTLGERVSGKLNVINTKGILVSTMDVKDKDLLQVNLADQENGIYYLELLIDDKKIVKKLIKE